MAKFRIYNIQLLPNGELNEVGKSGYRKLFSALREQNRYHLKEKSHRKFHYKMSGGSYFGPHEFNFKAGYVWGNFVKYDEAEELTVLATGKIIYKSTGKGGITTARKESLYIFDTERHLLAIDEGRGALPSCADLIEALNQFLLDIAEKEFPEYSLKINLISKPGELEKILETAESFKKVEIALTYPNGPAQSILQEMKDTQMKSLNLNASGGKGGKMTRLPDFLKNFLRAAQAFGKFHISYFAKNESQPNTKPKLQQYYSTNNPLTISMRETEKDEGIEGFVDRAYKELNDLDTSKSE